MENDMPQNRREFLKLIAASAATWPPAGAAVAGQTRSSNTVNVWGVGQWVVVRHKEGSQAYTSLCLLAPAHLHVAHLGWLAIHGSYIANSPVGGEDIGDGYRAWRLRGKLEAKGAAPVPPNPAKRNSSEEFPDDPSNAADWADSRWVANLKYVSPGYKVKPDWMKACISHFPLTGTIPMVGRPPCKKKDAEAIWTFATKDGAVHRQALTDQFGFGMLFSGIAIPAIEQAAGVNRGRGAAPAPSFRLELKMDASPEIFLIAARPKRRNVELAASGKPGDDEYKFGFPLDDFATVHTIIEKGNNAIPYFDRKHQKPGKDQECKRPVHAKDLDIFCPPAQLDA
jgi:hypothetical protein